MSLPRIHQESLLPLVLLLCGAVAACGPTPLPRAPDGVVGALAVGGAADARPVSCPSASFFPPGVIRTITVPADFARIDLTHGHTLEFDENAVPAGSQYVVSRGGDRFAALRVEPVGDAPMRFNGFARLTVNYAACGIAGRGPGFGLYRFNPDGSLVSIPSVYDQGRVSGLLTDFSVYGIGTN